MSAAPTPAQPAIPAPLRPSWGCEQPAMWAAQPAERERTREGGVRPSIGSHQLDTMASEGFAQQFGRTDQVAAEVLAANLAQKGDGTGRRVPPSVALRLKVSLTTPDSQFGASCVCAHGAHVPVLV